MYYFTVNNHKQYKNKIAYISEMPSIIIIDKTGSVKSSNVKTLDVSELYKKCGFKSATGFSQHHMWPVEFNGVEYKLQLYGKIDGKAGSENKYEFPPPVDKILFFGSCAVLNIENDVVSNMDAQMFSDIMDYLQGGYSDIGSEEDDDDTDESDIGPTTKDGYQKDGFVVDDEEEEDSEYSEDSEPKVKVSKETKVLKVSKEVTKEQKVTKETKASKETKATIFAAAEKYVSQVVEKPSICIKKPTKPRAKKVEEPAPDYCSENVTVELVEEEYLERI
jgi:hypothetical protein